MTEPTPPVQPRAPTGRATLPRELADFLIDFSIALHKHAMYPGGHPTLAPAAEAVAARLDALLAERGTLSLGVARDQLVIEGVATDPRNPVLHDLADRLHRHHLGAVSFAKGVAPAELEEALRIVALESERTSEPLGLRPANAIPRWPHIQLFPLTFERLELVGGPEGEAEGEGGGVAGGRPALLWVGLARAALAAGDQQPAVRPSQGAGEPVVAAEPPEPYGLRPEPVPRAPLLSEDELEAAVSRIEVAGDLKATSADPDQVARAIEAHERGTAYDQVIVGYMLQIAEELKTAGGAASAALKKRMGKLITSLDQGTLTRLIDMGGDARQRRQFLLNATQGMAVDAVVDLARAASGTGAPISSAMLRMLQKLSRHAERGPPARRTMAESALREQMAELVQGWELADPNPGAYGEALQRMAMAAPTLVAADEAAYAPEPDRVVRMAIEAGAVGSGLSRAIDDIVASGQIPHVIDMLERAPRDNAATAAIRSRVLDPAIIKLTLSQQPADFALADRLIQALGAAAVEPMLDVLAESESRQVRRALIDRLVRMPDAVRPLLSARVGDERWYVVRNVLYLAAELPGTPLAVDARPFRQHPDLRVRREALRVLFRDPEERARAVCTALTDEDPRIKRLALAAVAEGGVPDPAVPLLAALADDGEADTELRVPATRALGAKGGRLAVEALLKLTQIRRRSIIDVLSSASASAEFLAALTALGAFRGEPRVRERLELALRSKDPAVARAAAEALKGDG